jgi:hypothetical protein
MGGSVMRIPCYFQMPESFNCSQLEYWVQHGVKLGEDLLKFESAAAIAVDIGEKAIHMQSTYELGKLDPTREGIDNSKTDSVNDYFSLLVRARCLFNILNLGREAELSKNI